MVNNSGMGTVLPTLAAAIDEWINVDINDRARKPPVKKRRPQRGRSKRKIQKASQRRNRK